MKKKWIVLIVTLVITISSVFAYRGYTNKKIDYYVEQLSHTDSFLEEKLKVNGDVRLDRVLKRSPKELVILVRWGNDKVYVSIEGWLGRAQTIHLNLFDKVRGVTRMQ